MKKHQAAKYKKRKKKELANRKAKQLLVLVRDDDGKELASELGISKSKATEIRESISKSHKPISPARRAFQDV